MHREYPFPGVPIEDTAYFINQRRTLEKLRRKIEEERRCVLVGGSKMGKTSLLHRLSDYYRHKADDSVLYIPAVYRLDRNDRILEALHGIEIKLLLAIRNSVDAFGSIPTSAAESFRRIVDETISRCGKSLTVTFEHDLQIVLRQLDKCLPSSRYSKVQLLVLLDGLDVMPGDTRRDLIAFWDRLLDDDISAPLQELAIIATSAPVRERDIWGDWPTIPLRIFLRQDVDVMLRTYLQIEEIPPALLDQVEYYSSGFPYMIHKLMHSVNALEEFAQAESIYRERCQDELLIHFGKCEEVILHEPLAIVIIRTLLESEYLDWKSLSLSLQQRKFPAGDHLRLGRYLAILISLGIVIDDEEAQTYRVNPGVYGSELATTLQDLSSDTNMPDAGCIEKLMLALEHSFTVEEIRRLTTTKLGIELDSIVAGKDNLKDITYKLVRWAQRQNRMEDLVKGAREMNERGFVYEDLSGS